MEITINDTPQEVIINGTTYTPVENTTPSFGVAISTHNRRETLNQTLPHVIDSIPTGTPLVITCDNPETYQQTTRDHANNPRVTAILESQPGVYASKNTGLNYLMTQTTVDHLFLLDDDIHPTEGGNVWTEYINAPEPHYAHSFNLPITYQDTQIVVTTRAGGTLLYATRHVVEQVGGMSREFGTWGCEHVNWSDRIHNQGHTTHRYQDIPNAYHGQLLTELDRPGNKPKQFTSSSNQKQQENNKKMYAHWESLRENDARWIEYRNPQPTPIAITTLYATTNPQTKTQFNPTYKDLKTLHESTRKHGYNLHVITNQPDLIPPHAPTAKRRVNTPNPYQNITLHLQDKNLDAPLDYERWYMTLTLLNQLNQQLGGLQGVPVWVVDATDTELLHPLPHKQHYGRLFIGYEPQTPTCKWVETQISNPTYWQTYQETVKNTPFLVNAGILGGDGILVHAFIKHLCSHLNNAHYWENPTTTRDMVPLQTAATTWPGHLETGPHVTTVFKTLGEHGEENAIWRHK